MSTVISEGLDLLVIVREPSAGREDRPVHSLHRHVGEYTLTRHGWDVAITRQTPEGERNVLTLSQAFCSVVEKDYVIVQGRSWGLDTECLVAASGLPADALVRFSLDASDRITQRRIRNRHA